MNCAVGVILFIGIFVLIGLIVLLRSSQPATPTSNIKTHRRTSDVSTEVHLDSDANDDAPPVRQYSYTTNSSEIGLYRGNNIKCFRGKGKAFSNIKIYDDDIIFVNRDVEKNRLTNFSKHVGVYLADINGPPGFGKSRLAIQWGKDVAESGTDVRYVDIRDSVLETVKVSQYSKDKETHDVSDIERNTQLTNFDASSRSTSGHRQNMHRHIKLMLELINWSENIKCPTILILDNADYLIYNQKNGGANELLANIKSMIERSQHNLHVVVTSQYQLQKLFGMENVYVSSLSLNPSVELILNVTNGTGIINQQDAELLAGLLGGCPLALKIVAGLLRLKDTDIVTLKNDLLTDLIEALSSSDDVSERLSFVFNISFSYLEQMNVHDCAFYASLFPGSFSQYAASAILPTVPHDSSKPCHTTVIKHSLLETYFAGEQKRFEMHILIREYSRKRKHSKSNHFQKDFNKTFSRFFTTVMRNHALFVKNEDPKSSLWDEHKFNHSLEVLNIQYLLEMLVSKSEHTLEELQVLAFATSTQLLNKVAITSYYHEFLNQMKEVCHVLSKTDCQDFYLDVIDHTLLYTCYSSTFTDHVKSLLSPCNGMFQCDTLREIHRNRDIWIRIRPHGYAQIYLRHLELSDCKPLQIFNFHFPWPVLFLIASAECAVTSTITRKPSISVSVVFLIASCLCFLDIFSLAYEILFSYTDHDDVVESCIASVAEILIYLPSFVIYIPRIFVPYCKIYRDTNLVTRSHVSYSLFIVLVFIGVHYAYTSFPNVLLWYSQIN